MTETQTKIFEAVQEVNERLEGYRYNDGNMCVIYETDGYVDCIKLSDIILWESENYEYPEGEVNWTDFIINLILDFASKLHLVANTIK